jgi:hypothetical protein
MLTAAMVLIVMLQMPAGFGDAEATTEERAEFMRPVAVAIAEVANETHNPVRSAAILVALGKNETRFARYVLEGRCEDGPPGERCDWSKKLGQPRARGPFQVHDWCKAAWSQPENSGEGLAAGARCALSLVNHALHLCRAHAPIWPAAFAVYRGQPCSDGSRTGNSNFKGLRYARTRIDVEASLGTRK